MFQQYKVLIIAVGIIAIGVAYWLLSPLFIEKRVDDELPVITPPPGLEQASSTTTTMNDTAPTATGDTYTIMGGVHPASGDIRIIPASDGGPTTVRYENYNGTNGPDLHVYLATDKEASNFIDLGVAKGNKGNINYTVPSSVDLTQYPYVLTWCKSFSVLFDYAKIN